MKIVRAFVAAALVCAVVAPAAAAGAATKPKPAEHDFDTNSDGKIDLKIYDTNNDGYYEWPTGTKTFVGDLNIDVPIAVHGSVGMTADGVFFEAPVVTLPGTTVSGFTVTARDTDIYEFEGPLTVQSTGNITMTAHDYVVLDGENRLSASNQINLTALNGGVEITSEEDAATTPGWLLSAQYVNLLAKGSSGSVFMSGARIGGRKIVVDTPNASTAGFHSFGIDSSILSTNPARTGIAGNPDIIFVRSEDPFASINSSDIDSGKSIVLKTMAAKAGFCVDAGSITARNGNNPGTIDVSGVRGVVTLQDGTVVSGKFNPAKKAVVGSCF